MTWQPGDWPTGTSADAQLRIEADLAKLASFQYVDAHGRAPSNSHASHRPVATGRRSNLGRMANAALVPNWIGEDFACLGGTCSPQNDEATERVRRLQALLVQLGGPVAATGVIDPPTVAALRNAIYQSQVAQRLPVDEGAIGGLTAETIAADLDHVIEGVRVEIDRRAAAQVRSPSGTALLAGVQLGAAAPRRGRRILRGAAQAALPGWAKVMLGIVGVAAVGGSALLISRRRRLPRY